MRAVAANSLFSSYQPIGGTYDEVFAADGRPHKHCRPVIDTLNQLSPAELDRSFRQAQQLVRDDGVSFNVFDESGSSPRSWQLDILPVMTSRADFQLLSDALIQ